MWVVSTAGTPELSTYLLEKVKDGRERVERGDSSGVAYFEWSSEDNADWRDEEVWRSVMPALGHTTPIEAIRSAADQMTEPEFRRAYLNQWVTKSADDLALPLEHWNAAAEPSSELTGMLSFAIDVSPSRDSACIGAYGLNLDGIGHVEAVDHRRGTDWIVERMAALAFKWGAYEVTVDSAGPAASLVPDLEAAGLTVRMIGTADVTTACASMYDALMAGTVRHIDQTDLNAAVAGAKRRGIGDRWAYGRRTSAADITPIVAVTLARHAFGEGGGDPGVWFL
jgi:hypothetical protein